MCSNDIHYLLDGLFISKSYLLGCILIFNLLYSIIYISLFLTLNDRYQMTFSVEYVIIQ